MMGHRSVENPRSVSTALRGELSVAVPSAGGTGNGVEHGWVFLFGGVPNERAAITS